MSGEIDGEMRGGLDRGASFRGVAIRARVKKKVGSQITRLWLSSVFDARSRAFLFPLKTF